MPAQILYKKSIPVHYLFKIIETQLNTFVNLQNIYSISLTLHDIKAIKSLHKQNHIHMHYTFSVSTYVRPSVRPLV